MQDNVYKLTEIVGTSHKGTEDAIQTALSRVGKSIRNVRWFEVIATRGIVEPDGRIQYQVTLKVGFTLDG
ncbi:MAG: dodecin [Novosphingobium sp.]